MQVIAAFRTLDAVGWSPEQIKSAPPAKRMIPDPPAAHSDPEHAKTFEEQQDREINPDEIGSEALHGSTVLSPSPETNTNMAAPLATLDITRPLLSLWLSLLNLHVLERYFPVPDFKRIKSMNG